MARIILITGGCRSGKSTYAQKLAERFSGQRMYIATCSLTDEEMQQRVREHQQARQAANWKTLEEPLQLCQAIQASRPYAVVLVDCLTLWINNLMYAAKQKAEVLNESHVAQECQKLTQACQAHPGIVILVTNEVGMGIVPENSLARQYRDLIGRCNQVVAASAKTVILTACGIPLFLKGNLP